VLEEKVLIGIIATEAESKRVSAFCIRNYGHERLSRFMEALKPRTVCPAYLMIAALKFDALSAL
jgi:hypothetical protein